MTPSMKIRAGIAALFCIANAQYAFAETSANQQPDNQDPVPSSLTIPSPSIAAHPDVTIESMKINIAVDRVSYDFALKNKGKTSISLAASVELPVLEVSDTESYELPTRSDENPIDLTVKADGKILQATPYIRATAMGIDRLGDLKSAHIPLVPFAEDTGKALEALTPETHTRLASLGLVSPIDPKNPKDAAIADWALEITYGWTQTFEPGKSATLDVSFQPVKLTFTVDKKTVTDYNGDFDAVCFTPKMRNAVKAMLKGKNASVSIVDMTVDTAAPVTLSDALTPSISVHKPKPNTIVAFCGEDEASADLPVVTGNLPDGSESKDLRILFVASPGS